MSFVNNKIYDDGLNTVVNDTTHLYICSQEPSTYTEAVSTYALGVKSNPTISGPSDRTGGGRVVTIAAITDGTCTEDGTATHYAVVDSTNSRLLFSTTLSTSATVQDTLVFTLTELTIEIPSPS